MIERDFAHLFHCFKRHEVDSVRARVGQLRGCLERVGEDRARGRGEGTSVEMSEISWGDATSKET